MFNRKKRKKDKVDLINKNYVMSDRYSSDDLVVANLEYISSEVTPTGYGPKVITTEQKYIFEKIKENDQTKYREVFTGFVADSEADYFDLPYVINVKSLKEERPSIIEIVSKYSLLLIMNDINKKQVSKTLKK